MRRFRPRPAILKTKAELAALMRKKMPNVKVDKSPMHNYYWSAKYTINGQDYYVYVQHFTQAMRRMQVEYIHLRKLPGHVALTVKEIRALLEVVKKM
jgi:hypothetical protein